MASGRNRNVASIMAIAFAAASNRTGYPEPELWLCEPKVLGMINKERMIKEKIDKAEAKRIRRMLRRVNEEHRRMAGQWDLAGIAKLMAESSGLLFTNGGRT